jgi:biotin operon repressor
VRWGVSHRFDKRALPLADRHYNRPPGSLRLRADARGASGFVSAGGGDRECDSGAGARLPRAGRRPAGRRGRTLRILPAVREGVERGDGIGGGESAGIIPPPDRFTFRRNVEITLSDLTAVRHMAKQLEFHDLIVLDSLASFWPGLNENDPEHMSMVAEALKILCEHSGASILGIHHTTKAAWKPGEKPSLGELRGHGAMAGRIDAAFICRPMERVAGMVRFELHVVKQRDEDWTTPKAVEVIMTGDAATVTMEPLGQMLRTGTPLDYRNREIEQQILLALPQEAGEAISGNAICEKVKKSKTDVLAAIKRLFAQQKITQDWTGKYYRVKAPVARHQPSDPGTTRRFGYTRTPGEDDDTP